MIRSRGILVGLCCAILVAGAGEVFATFLANSVSLGGISITTAGLPPVLQRFSVRLLAQADTELDESDPIENKGTDSSLEVSSRADENHRALFRFDLAALPDGSIVDNCSLNLWLSEESNSSRTHEVYRLAGYEADWGEGTQSAGTAHEGASSWLWSANPSAWTTPGGDLAALPVASVAIGEIEDLWRSWDVSSDCGDRDVRSWLVRDRDEDETSTDGLGAEYASRETSGTLYDPYLALEFFVVPPNPGHLVVNEVYYDVASGKGSDTQNEWVELYNPTSLAIDLSGWSVCDNFRCRTVPPGTTIGSHAYAVVTPSQTTFDYWTVVSDHQVVLGATLGLSNSGDQVRLLNSLGDTVDALSYGSDTSIMNPALVDADKGWSLVRLTDGFDTEAASNFWANPTPTPGS